jgi:RNA polymerase sigma-70 factor (ECF subfamily)
MTSEQAPSTLGPVVEEVVDEGPPASHVSRVHAERMESLFREEYPRVVRYLVARTRSWPEAREIAAEAFSQILGMRNPEAVNSLKAYVYRAATNLATNRHKLGANRSRLDRIVRYEFPDTTPSPEPAFSEAQRLEALQQAMAGLRPLWREVLTLRFWEELPYEEIVARLQQHGVSVTHWTVRRWVDDALTECGAAIRVAEGEGNR